MEKNREEEDNKRKEFEARLENMGFNAGAAKTN